MSRLIHIVFVLTALTIVTLPAELRAQSLNAGKNLAAAPQAAKPGKLEPTRAPVPQAVLPALPPAEDLLGLIRTTLVALNQANQTGNYTVLRDLAAPDFRNLNDASKLGAIFQVLREQAVDLTPLLLISPEVSRPPAINQNGLLSLVGFFPTQPLRVNFDLSFQNSGNAWRPYGISVFLAPPPAPPAPAAPVALAPVANLAKPKK